MQQFHYSNEQRALHKAIVDEAIEGIAPAERPKLTVITGAPRTGKAALLDQYYNLYDSYDGVAEMVVIAPFAMTDLPFIRDNPKILHPEKLPQFSKEYHDVCFDIARAAYKRGCSVLWFDQGDNAHIIERVSRLFKGYEKQLGGVFVRPEHYEDIADRPSGRRIEKTAENQLRLSFAKNWERNSTWFDEARLFAHDPSARAPKKMFQEVARKKPMESIQVMDVGGYKEYKHLAAEAARQKQTWARD